MRIEMIIAIILGAWLFIVSFFLLKIYSYFRNLTREVKAGNLIEVLDKVVENEARNARDLKRLKKELNKMTQDVKPHLQKVGYVRFNPFSELGGDHSFALALLDDYDNGVILTGLHTRERTRVYMKNIVKGKSKYELSGEEKKALTKAQKGQ